MLHTRTNIVNQQVTSSPMNGENQQLTLKCPISVGHPSKLRDAITFHQPCHFLTNLVISYLPVCIPSTYSLQS